MPGRRLLQWMKAVNALGVSLRGLVVYNNFVTLSRGEGHRRLPVGGVTSVVGSVMRRAKAVHLDEAGRSRKSARTMQPKRTRGAHAPQPFADGRHTGPRLQSGALAYRQSDDGQISVLVVGKRRSKKWGIPKGCAEANLTLADNAAKEAFEEAGVRGRIHSEPLGTYRAMKRVQGLKTLIEVWVYLLEVTTTARTWPEKGEREVKWCSPEEAADLLNEPLLAELCRRLAEES